jgi:hypothetical protein
MDTLILVVFLGLTVITLEIAAVISRLSHIRKDVREINMKSGWLDNIHSSLQYIENEITPPGALRRVLSKQQF